MEKQEVALTEEEYYDLFKALRFALEQIPDALPGRNDLLIRLTQLYKDSPNEAECEFVITVRVKRDLDAEIRRVQETALTDVEVDKRIETYYQEASHE